MKKITLLLMMLTLAFTAHAQFPEDFETAVPPAGWASFIGTNGEGTVQDWTTSTLANGGSQAAYVRYESVTNSAEDWLVTPQFTPTAGSPLLQFFQRQGFGPEYGTNYTVRVSTVSQTTHADFTIVDTQAEADFTTVYSEKVVDLTAYVGTPIYVAFVMEQNDGDNWYIDDVNMISAASPPNCATNLMPADMATNVVVTDGAVAISWDAPTTGDPATAYEVFFGTTSGNLPSLGDISATSVNITGNDYSTTYYWRVVAKNNGGSATGCAEQSFTTEDAPPPPANDTLAGAIPFTPSPAGTGCTSAAFTLPFSTDNTTDSGLDGTCVGTDTGLDQFFTWTATSDALIWNDQSPGNPGIVIRDTFGNEIACASTFADPDIELSGWAVGDDLIIQIYDFGTSVSDVAFCLEEYTLPTCPDPTDLTANNVSFSSASLSWTQSGSVSAWNVEFGAAGFTATGTPTDTSVANPFDVSSLTEDTSYEYYVQAICGTETSAWVGPFTFTTSLAPIVPDVANDFSTFPGAGWSEAAGPFGSPSGSTSSWASDDYGNDTGSANGQAAKVNIYSDFIDEYLISTAYNLSGATFYLNYDVALTEFASTTASTLGADDYVVLLVTQDNGVTWSELERYDASTAITASRQPSGQIELTGYGSDVKFAFYANSGANDAGVDNDFYIDNFSITSSALSVDSDVLEGFILYPNPVKNELFLNAQDNIQEVEVYNLLGSRVMSVKPNQLRTSISLETLATGMYVVKVKVDNKIGSYKIIKE